MSCSSLLEEALVVSWQDGVVSGLEAAHGKSVPCIVPAFVDPHVHMILGARHTQRVDFSNCSSRVDFTVAWRWLIAINLTVG